MRPVTLVLIVHDHQPVGNFDDVYRSSYDDAYEPFLSVLERTPALRLALHTSGPLLQWIAAHRPGYLARLRVLVERGQVELWGGGFFEPVLPSIPEPDRRGQIRAMADWLELELGRRPRGLWLTERVWEPGLASSLAAAGVGYTAVDDAHFVAAGFERDDLWGYRLTEDQGQSVSVFPIHRELRYLVPFGEPEETVALLARVAASGEGRMAVLGDDGEKFGVWPGTKLRCYEQGWLERWIAAIAAAPWIELRTPAEAIAHHDPLGLAYLPTASYHEMQEWALPKVAQERYHKAAEVLEPTFGAAAHDLLRGGHWRNFIARYPESNRLHKRMLRASRRLWDAQAEHDERWREARTRLWRAQCNCPYWHGVFGGLYLPHLRSALYRELIAAEAGLAPAETAAGKAVVERSDLDLDGDQDALVETASWSAWISARGGRLWALDDRRALWNWGDTLARRPEAYHARLREATVGGGEGKTIHGTLRLKEPGLARLVETYDTRGRDSFLDRWSDATDDHDWALERFAFHEPTGDGDGARVVLEAAVSVAPALVKTYRAGVEGLEIDYALTAPKARRGRLTVELNLGIHVPHADDRIVEVGGVRADPPHAGARARHEKVAHTAVVDAWADRRLDVWTDRPATLERAPIETVSLSEGGAERVFQGLSASYAFEVELQPRRAWTLRFRLVCGRAVPAPVSAGDATARA